MAGGQTQIGDWEDFRERENWCEPWTGLFHSYCLVRVDQKPQAISAREQVCVSHMSLWTWAAHAGRVCGETSTRTVQKTREQAIWATTGLNMALTGKNCLL